VLPPPSFALAFLTHRKTALELERFAGMRFRTRVCSPQNWLFDDRVKSEESALAKLQLGPVKSLGAMDDLYAATVVVPTPKEIPAALAAIKREFPDAVEKPRRKRSAETFRYDDMHLLVSLGDLAAGQPEGLRNRQFEVQIHTGLQYAWWRATHDVIYKGSDRSWRLKRMASQIRASLELLDAALSNLRGAADLLDRVEEDDDAEFQRVVEWLERWPEDRRPEDQGRFSESVFKIGRASRLSLDMVEETLLDELIASPVTTPFQAILGSVIATHGASSIERLPPGQYVLVTDEFENACPAAAGIPDARRAIASPDS
jgi:ppGpp synthetase/RelA/SpoT-type nucleotidyltranferase